MNLRINHYRTVLMSLLLLTVPNFSYAFDIQDIFSWFQGSNSKLPTIATVIGNLDGAIRVGIAIATWFSIFMAIYLAIKAINKLIRFSDNKETLGTVIFHVVSAGLMFSIIGLANSISETLGLGSTVNGLSVVSTKACDALIGATCGDDAVWESTANALKSMISMFRFVGTIALIRGVLAISELESGRGNTTYGKVFISCIAGVCMINIVPLAMLLSNTFAPGSGEWFTEGEGKLFLPTDVF